MRCRCKCVSQQNQQLTVPSNKSRYYYQDTFDDVPLNDRKTTITDVTGKTQNIKRVQESQNNKEPQIVQPKNPPVLKDVKQSQNKKEIKEVQIVKPPISKDVKQSQKQPEASEEYEEQEVI